jgi:hypothetical protein
MSWAMRGWGDNASLQRLFDNSVTGRKRSFLKKRTKKL